MALILLMLFSRISQFVSLCCLTALMLVPVGETSAAGRWPYERQVGRFHCRANFSLRSQDALFAELSHLQHELSHTFGIPEQGESVYLFLFSTQATYEKYLGLHFPQVPYRRALFIKEKGGPGMVFAHVNPEFDIDVRHESTHALLHTAMPNLPLWLDEGLAEYFEAPRAERMRHASHFAPLLEELRSGRVTSLQGLEKLTEFEQMGRTQYRHSWAWTLFLLHGPTSARQSLHAHLRDVRANASSMPLHVRLRRTMPSLEYDFAAYFGSLKRQTATSVHTSAYRNPWK